MITGIRSLMLTTEPGRRNDRLDRIVERREWSPSLAPVVREPSVFPLELHPLKGGGRTRRGDTFAILFDRLIDVNFEDPWSARSCHTVCENQSQEEEKKEEKISAHVSFCNYVVCSRHRTKNIII